jgi:hypothetical protein
MKRSENRRKQEKQKESSGVGEKYEKREENMCGSKFNEWK